MVNDCTIISISDMSAVFKYYVVKNKSDTQRLNVPIILYINVHSTTDSASIIYLTTVQTAIWACGYMPSATFLHFTILGRGGGGHRPPSPPLNNASVDNTCDGPCSKIFRCPEFRTKFHFQIKVFLLFNFSNRPTRISYRTIQETSRAMYELNPYSVLINSR